MSARQQTNALTLAALLPTEVLCVLEQQQLLSSEQLSAELGELVLDSRQVQAGDTFVAVPGYSADGRKFIAAAIDAGAALVLAEGDQIAVRAEKNIPIIELPELNQQLSALAGRYFGEPTQSMFGVGITGTNGKTSCSYWLAHLLDACGSSAAIVGTLGYGCVGKSLVETGMTTPDAIATQRVLAECQQQGAENVVMEVSSHSLDQGRVAAVGFDVAIFTNLSRDHLDYHGSEAAYRDAKLKLMAMPGLQRAVINLDDAAAQSFIAAAQAAAAPVWRYSINNAQADIYCSQLAYGQQGVSARLHTPMGECDIAAPVIGAFNVSNLLAVIAGALAKGLSLETIAKAVSTLPAVPGRMQPVANELDLTVLVDYAHTPDALASVLKAVKGHSQGQLWCVFGCGGDRDQGKRPQMGQIADSLADRIVVTSDNPRGEEPDHIIAQITAGITKTETAVVVEDRAEAIRYAVNHAQTGDCIVLAGKGHETYQQIGVEKLPFDDVVQARLALQQRSEQQGGNA
ncbi:UDP-N-acetylmuramoyl-L-alanyl-D-glutamate--2,6-diaminopimelate ligase [Maricurvus nonylphenolicus]|uniref:UDP-N-acetylmuramoyl-L-alanyl-D-glutamate--2, 6-diaminopimelate ligase n=1 Tax=Maricurvus nonylphenolicus TaxID=1008307 RepID=UPI0036F3A76F